MNKVIKMAVALVMSSTAAAATAQSFSAHDNLIAMDPAESSAVIKSVGYQNWNYFDPMLAGGNWKLGLAGPDMNSDYQGMGGPLEPLDGDMAVAAHDGYAAMGGPIEAQSGYPPCDPGPGDDRCIQLYERGVTGAGN